MFLILETTNSTFQSSDKGRDYSDLDAARKAAVEAASQIVLEEARNGSEASSVEAVLKDLDGVPRARLAISLCVAHLLVRAEDSGPARSTFPASRAAATPRVVILAWRPAISAP